MERKHSIQHSSQQGAALIVALVALLILTILGVTTMTDVLSQSSVVRNEQFRQQVFYAASSELNVQIESVNDNAQNEDDQIILDLLDEGVFGGQMELEINDDAATSNPKFLTNPVGVTLSDAEINGVRADLRGCPGESIGKVKVIAGNINTTARLDDGRGSIKSAQTQRYVYCWP